MSINSATMSFNSLLNQFNTAVGSVQASLAGTVRNLKIIKRKVLGGNVQSGTSDVITPTRNTPNFINDNKTMLIVGAVVLVAVIVGSKK